jgi:hypothetical protein
MQLPKWANLRKRHPVALVKLVERVRTVKCVLIYTLEDLQWNASASPEGVPLDI